MVRKVYTDLRKERLCPCYLQVKVKWRAVRPWNA